MVFRRHKLTRRFFLQVRIYRIICRMSPEDNFLGRPDRGLSTPVPRCLMFRMVDGGMLIILEISRNGNRLLSHNPSARPRSVSDHSCRAIWTIDCYDRTC